MAARREIRPVDREPPVTPDYLDNAVAYFADGGSLAPGHHSMTYVSGCVKYDGYSNFTINGQSTFEYPARDAFLRRHGGGCRTAGTVSSSADRSIDPRQERRDEALDQGARSFFRRAGTSTKRWAASAKPVVSKSPAARNGHAARKRNAHTTPFPSPRSRTPTKLSSSRGRVRAPLA